ncbi:hypothetical protein KM043_010601 [Ampulex compressa]|nr:hypothetical protein KM043_010601 [Ampulex compressa]
MRKRRRIYPVLFGLQEKRLVADEGKQGARSKLLLLRALGTKRGGLVKRRGLSRNLASRRCLPWRGRVISALNVCTLDGAVARLAALLTAGYTGVIDLRLAKHGSPACSRTNPR